MVVKEKRGRRRYIAFRTDREISDEQLLAELTVMAASLGIRSPKLIQFDGSVGIFRCRPEDARKVRNALAERPGDRFAIVTLRTSGTLRTLREKYIPRVEERV